MFSFKHNRIIQEKINLYLKVVDETVILYQTAIKYYLKNSIDEEFDRQIHVVFKSESKADDLRREIEAELYSKSLLPELRHDILLIIDHIDKIPNKTESILRSIFCQDIRIPDELNHQLDELVDLSVDTCFMATKAVEKVLGKGEGFTELVEAIDKNETTADNLEEKVIYQIFHTKYEPINKILFRDLFINISNLLDLSEVATDILTIIAIKRNF